MKMTGAELVAKFSLAASIINSLMVEVEVGELDMTPDEARQVLAKLGGATELIHGTRFRVSTEKLCRVIGLDMSDEEVAKVRALLPARFDGKEIEAGVLKQMVSLIEGGYWIEAIKQYRYVTGLGLKESKEAVEALKVKMEAGKMKVGSFKSIMEVK
jgi:ribosomal protein L7/L12